MRGAARDPAALELLRLQRSRLADRMRWPWWYQCGLAVFWALPFACPFLPHGVRIWPILVAALAAAIRAASVHSMVEPLHISFRACDPAEGPSMIECKNARSTSSRAFR